MKWRRRKNKEKKTENWITTWVEFIYVFCTQKKQRYLIKWKGKKASQKTKKEKIVKSAAFSFHLLSIFYKYLGEGVWTTTFTLNLTFRNWKKVVKVNCNLFALSKLLFLRIDKWRGKCLILNRESCE